jgi:hypothetical protein
LNFNEKFNISGSERSLNVKNNSIVIKKEPNKFVASKYLRPLGSQELLIRQNKIMRAE